MKIIIFGPPGSGKGTQSNLITQEYNISKISTGDILRKLINKNDQLGLLVKTKIKYGKLVDDQIIMNVIMKEIKKINNNNFILDGFPRTIKQAKLMDEKKIFIDRIIELTLEKKIIHERVLGRRVHVQSGRVYHIHYNPPKTPNLDDITHDVLIKRSDDNIAVINNRFSEYQNMHNFVMDYYKDRIKNGIIKYIQINAVKNIKNIFHEIKNFLK